MHRFLIGFCVPFIACMALAGWTHGRFGAGYPADWIALTLTLLIVPALSALAALSIVHLRRPRRWLLSGARGRFRAALLGFLASAAAIPLIGVTLYFANRPLPDSREAAWAPESDMRRVSDAWVVAPICFVAAGLAAWLLPTCRAGACIACGYDVRYSLDSGRCPECGRAF